MGIIYYDFWLFFYIVVFDFFISFVLNIVSYRKVKYLFMLKFIDSEMIIGVVEGW